MLALTECRIGQPGIVAAALNNPIADWAFPGAGKSNRSSRKSSFEKFGQKHPGLTTTTLCSLREEVFRKPEDYFDPFASPMLFFRTPATEVPAPPSSTPLDEFEQLSMLDREDFHRQQLVLSAISGSYIHAFGPEQPKETATEKRKLSRQFPSSSLSLRLPSFYISMGKQSPLADQAVELAKHLRKSVERQSKARTPGGSSFGYKVATDDEDDEQASHMESSDKARIDDAVQLTVGGKLSLWDDSPTGRKSIADMANWLRQKLC